MTSVFITLFLLHLKQYNMMKIIGVTRNWRQSGIGDFTVYVQKPNLPLSTPVLYTFLLNSISTL